MQMQPILTWLAEVTALTRANQLKREVAELQVKIEFQSMIIQHFLQRRFQHVLIGTRFYRSIFADGDSQLRVGEDAKNLFGKTSGLPDDGHDRFAANQIVRDVREGVQAFKFLLEKNELESSTKRLAEIFVIGEYMADVRTLDRDEAQGARLRAKVKPAHRDLHHPGAGNREARRFCRSLGKRGEGISQFP